MIIQEKTSESITIDEISVPTTKNITNFTDWLQNGAKENTSWIQYQIDPQSGRMLSLYSFTKKAQCDPKTSQQFLSTLINLPFNEIPLNQRKLKGNARKSSIPKEEELWQPQMILNGQIIKGVTFNAYKALWPQEGPQEIAGKEITIYLPKDPRYLSYFPYWIQVAGQVENAKIRVCDSGKNCPHLQHP